MKKFKYFRPKIEHRAALKTLLKRNGFKFNRDFYGFGCCIAKKSNRYWRFRFLEGLVDMSCTLNDFDRWANSTEDIMSIEELKVRLK